VSSEKNIYIKDEFKCIFMKMKNIMIPDEMDDRIRKVAFEQRRTLRSLFEEGINTVLKRYEE